MRRAIRSTCTPRRSSPPRSCWPPASRGSLPSRACSATASAAPLHHPEFTMLEWYRANEPYGVLIEDCAALLAAAAEAAGTRRFAFRGREADPFAAPERLTVARGLRPPCRHRSARRARSDRDALALAPRQRQGIRVAADDTWADVFSRVLVERIEPNLGIGRATILDEYPVSEAALARPTAHDPRVAERFELYVCGVEIANALRRAHRPGRAAPPLRGRDGREAARAWRALSDRRGFPRRARRDAAGARASRSASTGW